MKLLLLLTILLMVGGCTTTVTKYKSVNVPVLVCPAPPVVEDLQLKINELTEADKKDPGKVAQMYKATVKQLQGQIEQFKLIIDQYDKTSSAYDDLRKKVDELYPQEVAPE